MPNVRATERVIAVKVESAYGIDSGPVAADAVMVTNLDVKTDQRFVEIPLVKGVRGGNPSIFVGENATMTFECPLSHGAVNGTLKLGTAPNWDVLMRICAQQRTIVSAAVFDTATGGSLTTIKLASGASANDEAYLMHPISVVAVTGTSRAPSTAGQKNLLKFAANIAEHTGTTQSGSTSTSVILASTASADDDTYNGQKIAVTQLSATVETGTITDYNGSTRTATVTGLTTSSQAALAYRILFGDADLVGYEAEAVHFSGTIFSVVNNSTLALRGTDIGDTLVDSVFTPGPNLRGMLLKVTTGSNDPEIVTITSCNKTNNTLVLSRALATAPINGTSTFEVIERARIKSYDSVTQEATLVRNFIKATIAGLAYRLNEYRLITRYVGSTKVATVDRPFTRRAKDGTAYSIPASVEYVPLKNSDGEVTASIYYFEGTRRKRFVSNLATVMVERNSGSYDMLKFTVTGAVSDADDAAAKIIPSLEKYFPALPINDANKYSMSVFGLDDLVCSSFTLDMGNDVQYRDQPGFKGPLIMDAMPKLSLTADKEDFAKFNPEQLARENAVTPVWYANGQPGQMVVIYAGRAQISSAIAPADDNGILQQSFDMTAMPNLDGTSSIKILLT